MISRVGLERIDNLRIEILRMARYVQSIFNKTAVAVLERNEHQARDVIYSDSVIDYHQVELQAMIIGLTGILTPTGKELRLLTLSMNIVSTLERIGDKCVFICERSLSLTKRPPIGYHEKLKTMFELVSIMTKGAIDNLVDPSLSEAVRLCKNDDFVDRIKEEVKVDLVKYCEESPSIISRALDLMMIFSALEEIADLSTELMEAAVYIDAGRYYRCVNDSFQPVDFETQNNEG
ncbi:MAG TPA: phosphate uptake regulator PhoU [Mesotoga infera]|uniref:Phosphate uptake regulator PhoU n=1 Tax=Mesotoga infera TaxID=1236046 RepID=A0A7C1CS66_9BACT|nr:phosphate uptake regulator PhoU [Mesotoga infera]